MMPHLGETSAELTGLPGRNGSPVSTLTPSGSPYSYTAMSVGAVLVSAGTVSLIEFGRGGSFTTVGLLAGMLPVRHGDVIRVTYLVAPTMKFVPM